MFGKTRRDRYRAAKTPDWKGVRFVSSDVGCGNSIYVHRGYHYCTLGELRIARLLDAMGVAFTPDVAFGIKNDGSFKKVHSFVPDFVFNGDEYVWTEDDGTAIVIHGIECKKKNKKPDKVRLLYEQRGINILVLGDSEISEFASRGTLPLKLLRRKRN